ncbi:RING finger and CHY zinc finger domain-containing protein 1 isoform 1 [Quillaja saponaria]|uniref:RING finger and CHY zinc finger domain-containing protein 1 isoform 1 n=1 Tax=Quillaja saponaria TaxID=32244 RepID=A0AAD7PGS4_QUISA|nr:RING finger and CHY zinc finger domain-containing protein 1 isoform 1 [Quillaja saponaria]
MQVVYNTRRISRALKSPIFINSDRFLVTDVRIVGCPPSAIQWRKESSFSLVTLLFSGMGQSNHWQMTPQPMHLMMSKTFCSSDASSTEGNPTEVVKELYDKMLQSVAVKQTMPPNAWLWSLIENCKNHDDIKLLFNILQNLRRFRLSNLRIHDNFNLNLCRQVTKACAHVGAIDFGMKALWKHNIYGLTPDVASVHHLLLYAKNHNDAKLLVDIMKLIQTNDLPLQPGTADIVFSICYDMDNWELISKYSKKFVKGGIKLRQTSFDIWMEFASRRGDTESLWKIETLRSQSMKKHTLATGFSCAKGLLLEGKPDAAAAVVQVLNQTLSEAKKPGITAALQKLVDEWPLEVIKHQKEEDRKALAATLKSNIPAMVMWPIKHGTRSERKFGRPNQKRRYCTVKPVDPEVQNLKPFVHLLSCRRQVTMRLIHDGVEGADKDISEALVRTSDHNKLLNTGFFFF